MNTLPLIIIAISLLGPHASVADESQGTATHNIGNNERYVDDGTHSRKLSAKIVKSQNGSEAIEYSDGRRESISDYFAKFIAENRCYSDTGGVCQGNVATARSMLDAGVDHDKTASLEEVATMVALIYSGESKGPLPGKIRLPTQGNPVVDIDSKEGKDWLGYEVQRAFRNALNSKARPWEFVVQYDDLLKKLSVEPGKNRGVD